ncbi:MAG: metalloregulator ArsR/SmtB family transcription factor [Gemmatimonadota bacterium]|nr:metalloregulator ArsR/SmtB family transcription factor [Gemmatimonadota bacterium]
MTDPLAVVAEPRRRQILQLIWDRELSAGEIAEALPVSFAAVSQHLAKLRTAGLVEMRPEGRHRYYRARRRSMGTLAVYLESMWREKLVDLKRLAEAEEGRSGED